MSDRYALQIYTIKIFTTEFDDIAIVDGFEKCNQQKCKEYQKMYDILCYYKKWIIFQNITKYQMVKKRNEINSINNLNIKQFSLFIKNIINNEYKENIKNSINKNLIKININYNKFITMINNNNYNQFNKYFLNTFKSIFNDNSLNYIIKKLINDKKLLLTDNDIDDGNNNKCIQQKKKKKNNKKKKRDIHFLIMTQEKPKSNMKYS